MEGRLIVENFGPIKKVDIQLNKLMVLIGPQSGGKSTIAKLLAVINETFRQELNASDRRENARKAEDFQTNLEKYSIAWDLGETKIVFSSSKFNFTFNNGLANLESNRQYLLNRVDKISYNLIWLNLENIKLAKELEKDEAIDQLEKDRLQIDKRRAVEDILFNVLELLRNRRDSSPQNAAYYNNVLAYNSIARNWDNVKNNEELLSEIVGWSIGFLNYFKQFLGFESLVYVPAERIFTSMASGFWQNLRKNEVGLPECVLDFGVNFENSRAKLLNFKIKELGITYRYKDGKDLLDIDKGTTIDLRESSSGFQTMIPLVLVVEHSYNRKTQAESTNSVFIVEEPELNLYPITQKQLVDFLGERCVNDKNSLLVTTHSPYILSAFANLIKANEVAKISEEKKVKIKKVVPEKYWIDYNETSAYFIDKGLSKNIMDKKFKTIDFSQIDKASDVIGNEFDKLLTIEVED